MDKPPDAERLGKAEFDAVYDCPDPRAYFRALAPLDYRTPHYAQPIFRRCVGFLRTLRGRTGLTVLDLCCGYGVNAALINHQITLKDLYAHYTRPPFQSLDAAEMFRIDRWFYGCHRRRQRVRVVGVDVAPRALAYAEGLGLLDESFAANLETGEPAGRLAEALARVDLITVTGGLSYVGAQTFRHLLDAMPDTRPPWITFFPLRVTDVTGLIELFSKAGLHTERWRGLFPHRRFRGSAEHERALWRLRARGLDPSGKEDRGYYYASCYFARPPEDAARVPLEALVPQTAPKPLRAGRGLKPGAPDDLRGPDFPRHDH